MEQILHQIKSNRITEIAYSGDLKTIDSEDQHWLELRIKSRQDLVKELKEFQLDDRILSQIGEPEVSDMMTIYSKTVVINLQISKSNDIYAGEYLTILLRPGLIVTIIDYKNNLFEKFTDELNNNPYELKMDIFYVIYYMISQILHQSTLNAKSARQLVSKLSLQIDEDPDDLELEDIVLAKRKIEFLANIIEDQHITMGQIPKINWTDDTHKVEGEIVKILNQFRFLQNSMSRLEQKVRELHLHYQLILQEKGNKKLSTLTIIQAIFVPLTLVAGVYGMNFIVMPELRWTNGYYIILGIMALTAIIELWWFKRKGWFD